MRTDHTMDDPTDRIVVIGAGFAGLSAALHLAGAGREVVVCEQAAEPGGKAAVLEEGGYRLGYGPSVLTMPELIDETFGAVGETTRDRIELLPVEPTYRAHYADGSHIDVFRDVDRAAEEIERVCGAAEATAYLRYRAHLERVYRCAFPAFVDRNLDGIGSLPPLALSRLTALGGFGSLQASVDRYFRDERLRQIFSFQAMYVGVAPRAARAMYSMVTYMDTIGGAWLPRGGMHALPQALAAAAEANGVRFRYEDKVIRLETSAKGRFRAAITASGDRIPGDAVVITADPALALPELLGRKPRAIRRLEYAPSCLLMLCGAGGSPEVHHNVHFGRHWAQTFDELIEQGEPMSDPSFLVSTPTVSDPGLAPAGRHCYFVLFPVPNLQTGIIDWQNKADRPLEYMRKVLRRNGYHDLLEDVDVVRTVTPLDWLDMGCPAGTPFSAAHLFRQSGPFRSRNLLGGNMVLAGAGTHPGVGVPMALISGRLAAERITGIHTHRPVRA
ncbi:phytoene desaturase family protein [Nocardia goodfellowii]|uniref:Phytoene desaturase n=1 Tax=Nocardia goodfellowii TaxID=882446 RepID=A0ABS4QKC2_9NOCA|nr:phytoene desaturase family protein [Nocardia goodfellowii]MBP2191570.1 phytoene desaturase [Nocardia goodfellowii]